MIDEIMIFEHEKHDELQRIVNETIERINVMGVHKVVDVVLNVTEENLEHGFYYTMLIKLQKVQK